MTIFGTDISDHNAGLTIAQVKAAGLQFATARALSYPFQGSTPLMVEDPSYAGWRDEARAMAFPFACYVLFHNYFPVRDQVTLLGQVIGDKKIAVLIDAEPDGGSNPSMPFLEECYDTIKAQGMSPVPLYYPNWFWGSEGSPNLAVKNWLLVSSHYGANPKGSAADVYAAGGGDAHWPGWAAYGGLTPVVGRFGSQIQVAACRSICGRGEQSDRRRSLWSPDTFTAAVRRAMLCR